MATTRSHELPICRDVHYILSAVMSLTIGGFQPIGIALAGKDATSEQHIVLIRDQLTTRRAVL